VEEALAVGFGWSFYGFFAAAAIWMVLYFLWAFIAARSDKPEGLSPRSASPRSAKDAQPR
jgi:hypothetical protein